MPERAARSDAERLRAQLARCGLSQRGAARELGVSERAMRYWCAGEQAVPQVVWLALCWLEVRDHVAGYVRERED